MLSEYFSSNQQYNANIWSSTILQLIIRITLTLSTETLMARGNENLKK